MINKIVRAVGSIVFALAMYCTPILLACSFAYKWDASIAFILCFASGFQLLWLILAVYYKTEVDE